MSKEFEKLQPVLSMGIQDFEREKLIADLVLGLMKDPNAKIYIEPDDLAVVPKDKKGTHVIRNGAVMQINTVSAIQLNRTKAKKRNGVDPKPDEDQYVVRSVRRLYIKEAYRIYETIQIVGAEREIQKELEMKNNENVN